MGPSASIAFIVSTAFAGIVLRSFPSFSLGLVATASITIGFHRTVIALHLAAIAAFDFHQAAGSLVAALPELALVAALILSFGFPGCLAVGPLVGDLNLVGLLDQATPVSRPFLAIPQMVLSHEVLRPY